LEHCSLRSPSLHAAMTPNSNHQTGPTPQRHWEMLIISLLVVAASFALQVESGDRVTILNFALPPLCFSQLIFGASCPGCGLTRSFVYLAHGDWTSAWEIHRLGWLLAILTVLQIPYRIHGIRNPGKPLIPAWGRCAISYLLIGLLIGNWLLELTQ
jgi:Protein of unknown function (DUF2752)